MTDWKSLSHILPPDCDKFVVMLAEAGGADNELKIITRFQKVVRLVFEEASERAKGIVLRTIDCDCEDEYGMNEDCPRCHAVKAIDSMGGREK